MVLIQTFLPSHPDMSGQSPESSTGIDNQSNAPAQMWRREFDLKRASYNSGAKATE